MNTTLFTVLFAGVLTNVTPSSAQNISSVAKDIVSSQQTNSFCPEHILVAEDTSENKKPSISLVPSHPITQGTKLDVPLAQSKDQPDNYEGDWPKINNQAILAYRPTELAESEADGTIDDIVAPRADALCKALGFTEAEQYKIYDNHSSGENVWEVAADGSKQIHRLQATTFGGQDNYTFGVFSYLKCE